MANWSLSELSPSCTSARYKRWWWISPLTPGHFLIGRPLEALPSSINTNPVLGLKRWKLCQSLAQHFWKRWSAEYLNGLQRFNKWKRPKRNLQLDDIVLVKDNRTPPSQWPIGRVTMVHPAPDTLVRVVTVQTKNGAFVRPIVKLCLLLPAEENQKEAVWVRDDYKRLV